MKSVTTIQNVEFKGTRINVPAIRTEIRFDPICNTKHQAVPGKHWNRVEIPLTQYANAQYKFIPWAQANCLGKFSCCQLDVAPRLGSNDSKVSYGSFIIYFEHLNDALKFKLTNVQEIILDAD